MTVGWLGSANPKAATLGIAMLPQFLPGSEAALTTLFVLPTIQCVIDIVWCLGSRIDSIVLTRADYDFICQARSAILGGD
ncbi:hypothetical protein [Mycobacterium leprae]|uniref:hypothetical protein n=1 Tax=Mycobacterium leprae TaxID=1769 RepID=UPI00030EC388|nr:hypothetical protein [Mycobacterium leprae]OAR21293.1 hypothetical protein A8144_07170 [Mycobacterium leprae 3125609]